MEFSVETRMWNLIRNPFAPRKRVTALNDITLEIAPGERVAFLGPNGAGKTTLLKVIGGLLLPSRGRASVDGMDTVKDNLSVRQKVAYVLNEDRSFFWRLTGRENLEFFGTLDDLFGRKLHARIQEVLNQVGLGAHGDKRVSDYSSGMRQRLAIARGMMAWPDVLILDEPTRTLDPSGTGDMWSLISRAVDQWGRKSLLLATHRLEEAEALCDRICVVFNGRIVSDARREDLRVSGIGLNDFYSRSMAVTG